MILRVFSDLGDSMSCGATQGLGGESSFFPLCVSSAVGQAGAARQLCV